VISQYYEGVSNNKWIELYNTDLVNSGRFCDGRSSDGIVDQCRSRRL